MKKLILVLGDQLKADSSAFNHFDSKTDQVIMIESIKEAQYVWTHKAKIILFLSAMRHFAHELRAKNYALTYVENSQDGIADLLKKHIRENQITHLICVEPGEWRLKKELEVLAKELSISVTFTEDDHFYCTQEEFKQWAGVKKELRLEYFYRYLRKKHNVLMQDNGEPVGDQWNFDEQNRKPYPKKGPSNIHQPIGFAPDAITQTVIELVEKQYPNHPGSSEHFCWAVTRTQALEVLAHFVAERLPFFGMYQDAMWTNTPFGWHSLLSSSLNLKLISPKEVVDAAIGAWKKKQFASECSRRFYSTNFGLA